MYILVILVVFGKNGCTMCTIRCILSRVDVREIAASDNLFFLDCVIHNRKDFLDKNVANVSA